MVLSKIEIETVNEICQRLSENKPVRRSLPFDGRLHIDRQLPFICIGMIDTKSEASKKVVSLVKTQPSYLLFHQKDTDFARVLIEKIIEKLSLKFNSFLVLEIADNKSVAKRISNKDEINIINMISPASSTGHLLATFNTLRKEIAKIKIHDKPLTFNVTESSQYFKKQTSILKKNIYKKYHCNFISINIPSRLFFVEDSFLPLVYKRFQRKINNVFQKAFFTFCLGNTSFKPTNYSSLGRRSFVKAVLETDKQLSEIDNEFDLLLLVSPINTHAAWRRFKKDKYKKTPEFIYNPEPFDPMLLKKKLYKVPISKIEDPTLAYIFRKKQIELDRQISMVVDRNTDNFYLGSLQVYGRPDMELLEFSKEILAKTGTKNTSIKDKTYLSPKELSRLARKELDYYKNFCPEFDAGIEIRDDISGVMVSKDKLLISSTSKVSKFRLSGLLHHEVGIHLLTYFNGSSAPFNLISCGLDGYEQMQEGLAVFAEYISGKLNRHRLKLLAARVIAVDSFLNGSSFISTFELIRSKGFVEEVAFNLVARIYRSGGFTKDYIYLDGFLKVLNYIQSGGNLLDLLLGKYSFEHLQLILELRDRKIINEPLLIPRFLKDPNSDVFLRRLKSCDSVKKLLFEGVLQ